MNEDAAVGDKIAPSSLFVAVRHRAGPAAGNERSHDAIIRAVTVRTSPADSAATTAHRIAHAIQVTAAAAIVEAVATAEAINASTSAECARHFDLSQRIFLDSFQSVSGISLESLENTLFPFASRRRLQYRWRSI